MVPSSQPEPPVDVLVVAVVVEVGPTPTVVVVDVTVAPPTSPPTPLLPVVFVLTEQAAAVMPTNAKPTSNFEVFIIYCLQDVAALRDGSNTKYRDLRERSVRALAAPWDSLRKGRVPRRGGPA